MADTSTIYVGVLEKVDDETVITDSMKTKLFISTGVVIASATLLGINSLRKKGGKKK